MTNKETPIEGDGSAQKKPTKEELPFSGDVRLATVADVVFPLPPDEKRRTGADIIFLRGPHNVGGDTFLFGDPKDPNPKALDTKDG